MPPRLSSADLVRDGGFPQPPRRVRVKTQLLPKTWLVIPSFANTVAQLVCYLRTRLSLPKDVEYDFYLEGSVILPDETIDILRDGDHIQVYPSGQAPPSGSHETNPTSSFTRIFNASPMRPPLTPSQQLSSAAETSKEPSNISPRPASTTTNHTPSPNQALSISRRKRSAEGRRRRNVRNRRREKKRRQEAREAKALEIIPNSTSSPCIGSEQQATIITLKPREPRRQSQADTMDICRSEMKIPLPYGPAIFAKRPHRNDASREPAERSSAANSRERMSQVQANSRKTNNIRDNSWDDRAEKRTEKSSSPDIIEIVVKKNTRTSSGARTDRALSRPHTLRQQSTEARRPENSPIENENSRVGLNQPNRRGMASSKVRLRQAVSRTSTPFSTDDASTAKSPGLAVVNDILETVMNPSNGQKLFTKENPCRKNNTQAVAPASHILLPDGSIALAQGGRGTESIHERENPNNSNGLLPKVGFSNASTEHLPSTFSLSIALSEIQHAKELNPVVNEKQNLSQDLGAEIDDILKVLDSENMGNSSPTAVANTISEESNTDKTASKPKDDMLYQQTRAEGGEGHQTMPISEFCANSQLAPVEAIEYPRSSEMRAVKELNPLLNEKEYLVEEPGESARSEGIFSKPVQKKVLIANDVIPAPNTGRDQEACAFDSAMVIHCGLQAAREPKQGKAKRRRVDSDYTFSEKAVIRSARSSVQSSKFNEGRPIGGTENQRQGRDAEEVENPRGTEIKSRFLEEILDLGKALDLNLPETDRITLDEQDKAPAIPQDNMEDVSEKKVGLKHGIEQEPAQRNAKMNDTQKKDALQTNVSDETEKIRDARHASRTQEDNEILDEFKRTAVSDILKGTMLGAAQPCEEERGGAEDMESANAVEKALDSAGNHLSGCKTGHGMTAKNKRRGALSVSAALRFAREQNMLQGGHKVKRKASEPNVHVQEPLCLSPKAKKRKKKKRKKSQTSKAIHMIDEEQYNESVLVGFEADSGKHDKEAQQSENAEFALPPPSWCVIAVGKRDPSLFASTPAVEQANEYGGKQTNARKKEAQVNAFTHFERTETFGDNGNSGSSSAAVLKEDNTRDTDQIAAIGTKEKFSKASLVFPSVGGNEDESILHEAEGKYRNHNKPIANCERLGQCPGVELRSPARAYVPSFMPDVEPGDEMLSQDDNPRPDLEGKRSKIRLRNTRDLPRKCDFGKEKRELSGEDSSGENECGDGPESVVPTTFQEKKITSRYEAQGISSEKEKKFPCAPAGERVPGGFKMKSKFLDGVVSLMIDTTVELEYVCAELSNVKSKNRDNCL
ncbi:unnamed protein product [Agarophyton chilense]